MAFLSDFGGEAPPWTSGKIYAIGQCVRDPMDWYFRYVRITTGAGTTNPINDPGNWRPDGARPIKSIQRGSLTINSGTHPAGSVPITISAVNTSRAEVRFLGGSGYSDSSLACTQLAYLTLTNSTTLTASVSRGVAGFDVRVAWEITEYY